MSITATATVDEISPIILWDKAASTVVAADLPALIWDQAAQGIDFRGKKFEPYSAQYASDKGVAQNRVSLQVTGDMLAAVQPKATKRAAKAVVKWRGLGAYPFVVDATRGWIGLTNETFEKFVAPVWLREFDKLLNKAYAQKRRREQGLARARAAKGDASRSPASG